MVIILEELYISTIKIETKTDSLNMKTLMESVLNFVFLSKISQFLIGHINIKEIKIDSNCKNELQMPCKPEKKIEYFCGQINFLIINYSFS